MHHVTYRRLACFGFFVAAAVYLWLVVDPPLIYHGFGTLVLNVPRFSLGWPFLRESMAAPGGPVVYLYGLLSQGYVTAWLGAVILVSVAWCLGEISRSLFAAAGYSRATTLYCLPSLMVLWSTNQYDHVLCAGLTVLAGLLFAAAFERLGLRRPVASFSVFALMAVACAWLAGAGGLSVFGVTTTTLLLFRHARRLVAVLILPAGAAILWGLSEYVFHLSPGQAFKTLTPFSRDLITNMTAFSRSFVWILYLYVPVTVSLIGVWKLWRRPAKVRPGKKGRSKANKASRLKTCLSEYVIPVLPLVGLALGLKFTFNRPHRQIVLMNSLARQSEWSDMLEVAERLPKNVYNIYCNHDINRALHHTGRLGRDLFCFPQTPHALLLTHEQSESFMTQLIMCDTFMAMGNVDDAEKLASEFLVDKGQIGPVLEKLAWIQIIKGQEQTARIYLNALTRDLMCRDRAEAMLSQLDHGFDRNISEYVRRIGSYVRDDGQARLSTESIEQMLTGLIKHNPKNRMAFEYLMTAYLLSGQIEKIAQYWGRVGALGYKDVPILYEEAVLLYHASRNQRLNLTQLKIRRTTFERYSRFVKLCNAMQTRNRHNIQQQLMQEFGTSFFYYYSFTLKDLAASRT